MSESPGILVGGEKAGVLSRDVNGAHVFVADGVSFPFPSVPPSGFSTSRPSRKLPPLFETILPQGRRLDALRSRISSDDPFDFLPFVSQHPVFSFDREGEYAAAAAETRMRTTSVDFPRVPFGTVADIAFSEPLRAE